MKASYFSLEPLVAHFQFQRPLDWAKIFGRHAPLEVEIGFGLGEHLIRLAQQYPEHNFLGIENSWVAVRRTLRKIAQSKVHNIRLILVDAQVAFERLVKPRSLCRIDSLFPCPWPKKKHVKYRLYSNNFLKVLNSRLVKGGEFRMVTDHEDYLKWVVGEIPGTGFRNESRIIKPTFDTKYERKWHSRGQSHFFELILKKERHIAVALKKDIRLNVYRFKNFDPQRFSPESESGKTAVIFKEFVYDPTHRKGLQEVIVSEEHIRQHFWAEFSYFKGQWQLRVSEASSVIPTAGVKRALDLMYQVVLLSFPFPTSNLP